MPKTSRTNLTIGRISDFKIEEGSKQAFLWDTTVPGLCIRATTGSKSFVFERRFNGRTVRLTIGSCSAWKLPDARNEARRIQRLMDQGIDPRQEKADRKATENREGLLIANAWEDYLSAHSRQWSERHLKDLRYLARPPKGEITAGVLWPLLQKKLSDIDANTLIKWATGVKAAQETRLAEIETARAKAKAEADKEEAFAKAAMARAAKAKTENAVDKANTEAENALKKATKLRKTRISSNQGRLSALRQGFIRFRAFWRWAYQREEFGNLADPSIFSHSDLRSMLPAAKAKNDVLERGQLQAWFGVVTQIQNPIISAYLQVLLLTGTRRSELGALKWQDVDLRWKSIWVKDKVEEEGRKIPLTPYVEYLISALPRRNEYVFSSPNSASGQLVEPRIAHKRALSTVGLPSDLSIHGLRRSFASLAEWIEMPVGIVAQIMGHKPSATAEKHYKRRPLDLLGKWHTTLEEWILTEGGIDLSKTQNTKRGLHLA